MGRAAYGRPPSAMRQVLKSTANHRSFANCAIVLDVERDRYLRFNGDCAFALDWIEGTRLGPPLPSAIAALDRAGLLTRAWTRTATSRAPLQVDRSALDGEAVPGWSLLEFLAVAGWLLRSRLMLRLRPLRQVLDSLPTAVHGAKAIDDELALARRFVRYRRLVPLAPRCLPDCLAYLRFAHRRGHRPALVIGVAAYPFAAHCWTQQGSTVLTDELERVLTFSWIRTA